MKFDPAVRQNRRGFIRVAKRGVDLLPPPAALALVQDNMLITDRRANAELGAEEWEGYSPGFEPLAPGAAAPLYHGTFRVAEDNSLTLTFVFLLSGEEPVIKIGASVRCEMPSALDLIRQGGGIKFLCAPGVAPTARQLTRRFFGK